MPNPYEQICLYKNCKQPVEVIEGEDGPWTSGFCGRHNDKYAEQDQERREFEYYHPV